MHGPPWASCARVSRGSPMGRPWVAHELPMGCPWTTMDAMRTFLPWVAHGLPMGCPWAAYRRPWTPVGVLRAHGRSWSIHGKLMGARGGRCTPKGDPWTPMNGHGRHTGDPWTPKGDPWGPTGNSWATRGKPMGAHGRAEETRESRWMPMGDPWLPKDP